MSTQVIYKIRNVTNQKFYIGSTTNKRERFRNHRRLLRKGAHHCKHLQAAWNKYGEECFVFEVVEEIPEGSDLWAAEDRWLDEHFGKPYCYNAGRSADAPMRGRVGPLNPQFGTTLKEHTKRAIAASLREFYAAHPDARPMLGKTHTPETIAKILANRVPPAGENHYRYGTTLSEDVRAKIGAAQRGKPKAPGRTVSEEGKAKIRANIEAGRSHKHWLGRTHSDESKAKMGLAVVAALPDGTKQEFTTMSALSEATGVFMPTIVRACKSGKPIAKGALSGWILTYKGQEAAAVAIPPEYAHLPRTRQLAQEQGAAEYFTGIPCSHGHVAPRKTKGACVSCLKAASKQQNERYELAYMHQRKTKASLVAVYTDAPEVGNSEWPSMLQYKGFRWGRHELRTDVFWLPEDLETAVVRLIRNAEADWGAYWTEAERRFPQKTFIALRELGQALRKTMDTPRLR